MGKQWQNMAIQGNIMMANITIAEHQDVILYLGRHEEHASWQNGKGGCSAAIALVCWIRVTVFCASESSGVSTVF